jgi:hypothetical protein
MLAFALKHWETVVQFLVTAWMASIARNFQITLSVYSTRMEAHREALKRSYDLMLHFPKDAGEGGETLNETNRWIVINEVFLTPAAANAVRDVIAFRREENIRGWESVSEPDTLRKLKRAEEARSILRRELLRFRKMPLPDLIAYNARYVALGIRRAWRRATRKARPGSGPTA